MAFEDALTSNIAINKDIIPMQFCRRVKHVWKSNYCLGISDLGLDELDLSMNLECLELGPLDCKHMKILIPNIWKIIM